MPEETSQRIEVLKILANVATVLITVGLGTFGLGWMNAEYQARQKASENATEQAKVSIEALKVETERVRAQSQQRLEEMKNLGSFIEIALDQRLERRLRFAEYFAFMTLSEDFRSRWTEYHASLASDLNALLEAETALARAQQQGDAAAIATASQHYARLVNYSARLTGSPRQVATSSQVAAAEVPADAAARPPSAVPAPLPVGASCVPEGFRTTMQQLAQPHLRFEGSVLWAVRPEGLVLYDGPDDATPERLAPRPGDAALVQAIVRDHQAALVGAAKEFSVPVELLVAVVVTNSGGRPGAIKQEAGFSSEEATPTRISVGLAQMLLSTARLALKDDSLTAAKLQDPATNLRAAAAFVANQAARTRFDPPLVAAAYSAGNVFFQDSPSNRWKLRAFPIGTALEIDRFVSAFNATMALLSTPEHRLPEGVPSFTACLRKP